MFKPHSRIFSKWVRSCHLMPSAEESHPEMKVGSHPPEQQMIFPFGLKAYFVVFLFPLLPAPLIHPPQRQREKPTTCFKEESETGSIPDQSTSSSAAPWHHLALPCHLARGWMICAEAEPPHWSGPGGEGAEE